jgi:hypothetical protein
MDILLHKSQSTAGAPSNIVKYIVLTAVVDVAAAAAGPR